jgi:DNA-binding transcriptional regulator YhcF (GntR family)
MNLHIEYHSGIPVYKQLVSRFQAAIHSHELAAGTKLPPIRALAEQLDINPNTVAKVYRELELRGLIESKVGSGCYVLESAEEQITVREKERFMDALWKKWCRRQQVTRSGSEISSPLSRREQLYESCKNEPRGPEEWHSNA